jgi:hypothetical protein
MANFNAPRGLSPVGTLTGAAFNEQGQLFAIASDSTHTYAIGDVVKLAGGSDVNGVAYVSKAAATDVPVGVIVGIRPADAGVSLQGTNIDLSKLYLGLSAGTRYAYVITDPNVVFLVESDATGTSAADVGKNANLTITADQTSSLGQSAPLSNAVLNSASYLGQGTSGSLGLMLTITGLAQRVDNAAGAYADALVIFNRHQFKQANGTA